MLAQLKQKFVDAGFSVSHRDDIGADALSWFLDGTALGTLANWRSAGRGPHWYKIRGNVRYPLEPLMAWLVERDNKAD